MPCIITTVHDPVALAVTCRRLSLPRPELGTVHLDDREPFGWIVRLPGVRFPIVCDSLTGLIAYHPADNVFDRYARIMRWIYRCYDVAAQLRRGDQIANRAPIASGYRRAARTAQAG
jgi:hypothetical protein